MEQILKWLAGFGSEELPPGDTLRFEFASMPEGALALLLLAGFAGVVLGILWIYRRDASRLSPGRRAFLAILRLAALALVCILLLEPTVVRIRRHVRPGQVLILVDASQSMGHRDRYARSEDLAAAWKALGVEEPSAASRFDLVGRLLEREKVLERLAAKNLVRPYLFGSGLRAMPLSGGEGKKKGEKEAEGIEGERKAGVLPPAPRIEWARCRPEEGSTNLTASLRQALEEARDARIAAVLVLTDGRINAGGAPEEAGAFLARRKAGRLLVVGIGDPEETWSLELRDVQAAERVFKGDPLKVTAVVSAQGYEDESVTVRLKQDDPKGGGGKVLASVQVEVGRSRPSVEAVFPPVKLDREGEHLLVVEVDPPQGEAFDPEKHRRAQKVQVIGSQLKVLLVAGGPSHEFRTLKTQLIRDDTVHVATWLENASKDFPQDGNTTLKALPSSAEALDAWDVVILIDPDPVLLPPEFARNLAEAIVKRGTGLWWIAGEKFSLYAMKEGSILSPLVELLPIVPDLTTAEHELGYGNYYKTPWPWTLTPEGREHRMLRLVEDTMLNETMWKGLPGFYWSFPVLRKKPAAQILCRHPNPVLTTSDGPRPILVTQYVGAGRVTFQGTDEIYRWFGVAESQYDSYWLKGIRYLCEGRLAGGSSRLRLGLSADRVMLGKQVEVYLRALDERLEPLVADTVSVRMQGPDGHSEDLELKASGQAGRFVGRFRPNAIGIWKAFVLTGEGTSPPASFEVMRSELESKGPMARAALRRFAEAAGGVLLAPGELSKALEGVPSMSQTAVFALPTSIWDNWVLLALVVFFLTIEWVLRKRWNLL